MNPFPFPLILVPGLVLAASFCIVRDPVRRYVKGDPRPMDPYMSAAGILILLYLTVVQAGILPQDLKPTTLFSGLVWAFLVLVLLSLRHRAKQRPNAK